MNQLFQQPFWEKQGELAESHPCKEKSHVTLAKLNLYVDMSMPSVDPEEKSCYIVIFQPVYCLVLIQIGAPPEGGKSSLPGFHLLEVATLLVVTLPIKLAMPAGSFCKDKYFDPEIEEGPLIGTTYIRVWSHLKELTITLLTTANSGEK